MNQWLLHYINAGYTKFYNRFIREEYTEVLCKDKRYRDLGIQYRDFPDRILTEDHTYMYLVKGKGFTETAACSMKLRRIRRVKWYHLAKIEYVCRVSYVKPFSINERFRIDHVMAKADTIESFIAAYNTKRLTPITGYKE